MTVMVCESPWPVPSVTPTSALKAPTILGVPTKTPVELFIFRPIQKFVSKLQKYGAIPPEVCIAKLYGLFKQASGQVAELEILIGSTTLIVNCFVTVCGGVTESLA